MFKLLENTFWIEVEPGFPILISDRSWTKQRLWQNLIFRSKMQCSLNISNKLCWECVLSMKMGTLASFYQEFIYFSFSRFFVGEAKQKKKTRLESFSKGLSRLWLQMKEWTKKWNRWVSNLKRNDKPGMSEAETKQKLCPFTQDFFVPYSVFIE